MKHLTIGQVAQRAGMGIETVRFYEREGLLKRGDCRPEARWLRAIPPNERAALPLR